MKKKLLPIIFLSALGLVACGETGTSSQPAPVTSSSQTDINDLTGCSVTINNKEALQAEWHAGQASRSLDLTVNPNCNIAQYIKQGLIVVTSTDTSVVKVSGKVLYAMGAGTATVKVQYGADGADEVEITVAGAIVEPAVQERTVAGLLEDWAKPDFVEKQYKYHITGKISAWKDASATDATAYGNFFIADLEDSSKTIYVYGCNRNIDISFGANGLYSYTQGDNAKDWLTNDMTKDAMIGATVEINAIAYSYGTTKELSAQLINLTNPQIIPATSVTLDKETLEMESQTSAQLKATVLPEDCNQNASWTSSDETVASVTATGLVIAKAPGTATITVTVGEQTDTCVVTVVEPAVKTIVVDQPVVGTQYKFGLYQEGLGKKLYATGVDSGNYSAVTEEFVDAALFELVAVEGGYNVKVTRRDESVAYMNLATSNNGKSGEEAKAYVNVKMQDAASTVWSYDTELKTVVATINSFEGDYASGNGTYYVGTYGTNKTFSASKTSYAATSYVANFLLAEEFGPVKAEVGKKYPYGTWQANVGKTLYATGANSGNYAAVTTDLAEAGLFELVAVEGGYNVKVTKADESVVYMNYVTSNNGKTGKDAKAYVNVKFEETASAVWQYDDSINTVTVTVSSFEGDYASNNGTYYVGNYGTNETLSCSKTSYAATSFVGHFYDTVYVAPISAPLATAIALDKTTAEINVDEKVTLTATLTPANAGDEIIWSSSDEEVATVSNGVVTGKKAGTATITAKVSDELKAECTVTVVADPYTAYGKLDFSTIDNTKIANGQELTDGSCNTTVAGSTALGLLKSTLGDHADDLVSFTESKIYCGNTSGGWKPNQTGFLKTGTGSAAGKLVLTFAENVKISKVTMKVHSWTTGSTDTVAVNGCTPVAAGGTDTEYNTVAFTFDATNVLTFDFANRAFVQEIVLFVMPA